MNNSILNFVFLIVIALLSLAATYVLFKYLKSYAKTKEHKMLGGAKFQYGGALAGFVIVFSVLILGLSQITHTLEIDEEVDVVLAGEWYMEMRLGNGEIRYGKANVKQESGDKYVYMAGEVRSVTSPPSISFKTEEGIILENSNEIVFIYQNEKNETGMAVGNYQSTKFPQRFSTRYFDIRATDENMDVTGKIQFSKTEFTEQLALKNQGKQQWWLGKEPPQEKPFPAITQSEREKVLVFWQRVELAKTALDRSISDQIDSPMQFRTKWQQYKSAESDYTQAVKGFERFFKPKD